ncbi:MAG: hypothetical protein PWQ52_582 [Methanolobus sp.]|nr:hypothetical protein [Methanolobus sp.]
MRTIEYRVPASAKIQEPKNNNSEKQTLPYYNTTSRFKKVRISVHKSHVADAYDKILIREICPSAPKRSIFTLAEVV